MRESRLHGQEHQRVITAPNHFEQSGAASKASASEGRRKCTNECGWHFAGIAKIRWI